MKLSENIDKVFWSLIDKGLYVLYGLVSLLQFRRLEPSVLGIYALLIGIHTWFFIVVDSLFYQGIIQFGFDKNTERRTNTFALLSSICFILLATFTFSLLSDTWVKFFREPGLSLVASYLPYLAILTIPRVFTLKFAFKHSNMFQVFIVNSAFFLPMSILTIILFFRLPAFNFQTMMLIYFTGTAISSLTGIILLGKYIRIGFQGTLRFKEYFSFGVSVLGFTISQSIPRQLDVFILQYFFQSKIVGIYYSAKTLFRLFEEGLNAGYALVYPTTVRLIAKNRRNEIQSLIAKSTSFTFIIISFAFLFLELGGSKLIIQFLLPARYSLSISYFNLMIIGALFMPFQLGISVLIAEHRLHIVSIFILASALTSLSVMLCVGFLQNQQLIPLGIVTYYFLLGLLSYFYISKNYQYKINHLLYGLKDIINFIKQKISVVKKK